MDNASFQKLLEDLRLQISLQGNDLKYVIKQQDDFKIDLKSGYVQQADLVTLQKDLNSVKRLVYFMLSIILPAVLSAVIGLILALITKKP